MGYYKSGFQVVGVDIKQQKRYPFPFVHGDATRILSMLISGDVIQDQNGNIWSLDDFDAIHASPPCQRYSIMTSGLWKDRKDNHPDLISEIRNLLVLSGKPYIIENVKGARFNLVNPILLCGTMFHLQTEQGNQLFRHRYFELSWGYILTPPCDHNDLQPVGVYGHTGGKSIRDNKTFFDLETRKKVMGISWMTNAGLSEAIPPSYTLFIGSSLKNHLLERETNESRSS